MINAADAGYDSEANHRIARQDMGIASIIPPWIGRRTSKPLSGYWRRRMKRLLATRRGRRRCGYTQRWQVETTMSMIKRNLGDELSGKTAVSRKRDLRLKVLTHNLMIIRRKRVETEQVGSLSFTERSKTPDPLESPESPKGLPTVSSDTNHDFLNASTKARNDVETSTRYGSNSRDRS